jgi:GntR family transcriptional repressor for pyruvate dehydrogenase complex
MAIMTRLKADSLMQKVVDEITDMVLDGGMSVGDMLPSMAELGERFGVSYTVLREALRVLEAQGMIEIQHGKGTVVTLDPTEAMAISLRSLGRMHEKSIEYLMEVRSILELQIARLAAIRRDDEDLSMLHELTDALSRSLHDANAFIEADTGFHYALVVATHNPILARVMQSLRRVQRSQWEATTRMRANDLGEAYDAHRHVFERVRDGDPEGAVGAMDLLLGVARRDLELLTLDGRDELRGGL